MRNADQQIWLSAALRLSPACETQRESSPGSLSKWSMTDERGRLYCSLVFFITPSFRGSAITHLNAADSLSEMGFESSSLRAGAVVPPPPPPITLVDEER